MESMLASLAARTPQGTDFEARLVDGLRIPAFGPSRHFIRRGDSAPEEFFPDRCWAITAMPSFHSWGMFAVFEGRMRVRCAFVCRGDMPDKPGLDFVVADALFEAAGWSDPVVELLSRCAAAPEPDRSLPEGQFWATADGIGYALQVETRAVSTQLRFSNPREAYYRTLARAANDLAKKVSREIRHPQVSSFVNTWEGYIRG
jgi:hypothetical protein